MSTEAGFDEDVARGFGREWGTYDQTARSASDLQATFDRYFAVFPWDALPAGARGFDAGCGSGRWARLAAPRVGHLHAIDPSEEAAGVARSATRELPNVSVVRGAAGSLPLPDASMDFGYSLGVLHHTPDPLYGLTDCVRCLRPGAPMLVYLYYALDNRPAWFRGLWRASDAMRKVISRAPHAVRRSICEAIAFLVYLPLSRSAPLLRKLGLAHPPLEQYEDKPILVLRTDSYDRLATRLEHRYTKAEVVDLMEAGGLVDVEVSAGAPYWCAVGFKPQA